MKKPLNTILTAVFTICLLHFTSLNSVAQSGTSLALDGVDDYANASDNNSLDLGTVDGQGFTIEAWFYVPDLNGEGTQTLVYKQDAYAFYINFHSAQPDELRFRVWEPGPNPSFYTGFSNPIDLAVGWHHAALVFNDQLGLNDTWAVFLDGARIGLASNLSFGSGIGNSASALNIGAYFGVNPFHGWIDEVRLSDVVRYSGANYSVPTGLLASDANTRALWHFNESVGATSFTDASGNGNTLTGFNGAQTANPSGGDTTPPTAQSITRLNPSSQLTSASSVVYRVTFSEAVTNVSIADFTLVDVSGTITGESITSVSASNGTTIDVTVNTGSSGNGDLRLDVIVPGATITDDLGNALIISFTSGQIYSLIRGNAPAVSALPASNVFAVGDTSSATLNGTANPGGAATMAWFEWGTTSRHGSTTVPQVIGADSSVTNFSSTLTGLTSGITYRYRAVASNSFGLARGGDILFWAPRVTVNGTNQLTNECHVAFADPGATVSGFPASLAAGSIHSLALKADGTVVGWGGNNYGQTTIPAIATNVVALAAGERHSLALKADGTVVGWGGNDYGQTTIPASVTNVVALAVGYNHSLALKADGTVIGWGDNDFGQTTTPASATNVVALAAGGWCSLVLKADGTVVGWGFEYYGQTTTPASATNVVAFAAGSAHNLAQKADGTLVSWGDNQYGQTTIPASATNVVAIAAGGAHNLALKADGTVVGWGFNYDGETTIPASATNVVAIEAGERHSLALKADGTVVGWGYNNAGQTTIPGNLYAINISMVIGGTVNTNVPGSYTLTYSATNALGGVGTATRTVVVADRTGPTLALSGPNSLAIPLGSPFIDPGGTATDACAGDLTSGIVISGSVNTNTVGIYNVTYTIADPSGNSASTNRSIRVISPPLLINPILFGNGKLKFEFTNPSLASFTVLATTNVSLPLSNWTVLGSPAPIGGDVYQFTDPVATNYPQRFYQLRWP